MPHADHYLLAGVMGFPIMHSRSPAIHNYWLAEYGLLGHYAPLAVKPEGLEKALRACIRWASRRQSHDPAQGAGHADPRRDRSRRARHRRRQLRGRRARTGACAASTTTRSATWNPCARPRPTGARMQGPPSSWARAARRGPSSPASSAKGVKEIRLLNRTFERAQKLAAEFGSRVHAGGLGRARRRAGGRGPARQHHEHGHDRPAAARDRARRPARRAPSSATSSTRRWRPTFWPAPAAGARGWWTGSACCCTRPAPPSATGSAPCRR